MSEVLPAYPPGEYAIVELLGHTTLVGRITEVEKFGMKMLAIETLFAGALLPVVYQGGASIYRLTPCAAVTAFDYQPTDLWSLPNAIRKIVPPDVAAAALRDTQIEPAPTVEDDDDERPF